jgi:hypothetical protein
MRKTAMVVVALVLAGFVASGAWAHKPVGVEFYAPHIPDALLPDVDGNFADWAWYPEDLVITHDMLLSRAGNDPRDIADVDVSIKVAWNESTNKLYLALEAFDNFIHRDTENQTDIYTEDGWTITTDADHSGGFFHASEDLQPAEMSQNGQQWIVHPPGPRAVMWIHDFGENWAEKIETREWDGVWCSFPPYGDYAVGPPNVVPVKEGDQDVTLYYEIAWTLFDFLDTNGPDKSIEHVFQEDQITHLNIHYQDHDEGGDEWDSQWGLNDETHATRDGSAAPDWVMVKIPIEAPTSVEASTWGQIKSSFDQ